MDGREYWHDIVGYNYRMTNICAAIGLAQLERADSILKRKKEIADYYRSNLSGLPVEFQSETTGSTHSWWMFSILTKTKICRDELRGYLNSTGIETRPLFNPVHLMPMYNGGNLVLPVSESLSERGLNLPSWPGLTSNQLSRIVQSVKNYYSKL
jgi:perosamine synthetase